MGKQLNETQAEKVIRSFSYRNIKKEFQVPNEYEIVTKQFHLEVGEKNELKVVEDRACDWKELSNSGVDECGLANVLRLAAKGQVSLESLAYKDEEGLDLSDLNPMDPQAVKATIAQKDEAAAKLQKTADSLGVSVDDLIDSMLKGTLAELITEKTSAKSEEESEK